MKAGQSRCSMRTKACRPSFNSFLKACRRSTRNWPIIRRKRAIQPRVLIRQKVAIHRNIEVWASLCIRVNTSPEQAAEAFRRAELQRNSEQIIDSSEKDPVQ